MTRLPPGAAFTLSAARCAQIALCRSQILAVFQRNGGIPPGLLEDLDEMAAIARERDAIRVARDRGSHPGSDPVRIFDADNVKGEPVYVGMSEAVDLLKISDTAVRKALAEGRVIGRQRGGPGSSWLIDLESIERFARERKARDAVT